MTVVALDDEEGAVATSDNTESKSKERSGPDCPASLTRIEEKGSKPVLFDPTQTP